MMSVSVELVEKIVFWGCSLLSIQNARVFLRLIQAKPNKVAEIISVSIPRRGRTLKDILQVQHNEGKFKLPLWYLRIRDIAGVLSLFTGIFMVGAYVVHLFQIFQISQLYVFLFAFTNAATLLFHTLQRIKCQGICVEFGYTNVADGIKSGHY